MVWKVELDPGASRELDKLDPSVARRILKFLYERVVKLDDPRSIGFVGPYCPSWTSP